MTRLYFVRHGKTEWNLEGRYQGAHGDSPLLAQSYLEIGLLAEYLNNVRFAKAYCSPIKRARVTAQKLVSLLEYPVKLESDRAFQEFDLGKMEGMKFTEVAKQFPEELDAFRHHPDRYDGAKINGESYQDVIERMTPKIKAICERYPKENILIVSHGAALCADDAERARRRPRRPRHRSVGDRPRDEETRAAHRAGNPRTFDRGDAAELF